MKSAWRKFWTEPAGAEPLAFLRIGAAAILLLQARAIAPQFLDLYGQGGILQGALRDLLADSSLPGVRDLAALLQAHGINETTTLGSIGVFYLASLVALLLGFHTRLSATMAWLTHWLLASGHVTSYGLDTFAGVFLFYLVWIPSGRAWSLDAASGRVSPGPSAEARWALRTLQLHLSIAYLACGVDKAMGAQWWNGDAIWRSVTLPLYAQYDLRWLAKAPWIATLSGWGTLVVECGYPIGMWVRRLRPYWLVAIIGLHLGILALMGLPLFALMMIVLSVSAFGVGATSEDRVLRWGVRGVQWAGAVPARTRSRAISLRTLAGADGA